MAVKPIPDGYHSVTPYLIVHDAAKAIEFYKKAFGATELMRMTSPDGTLGHAEIRIGNSAVMLADENLAWGAKSAKNIGGSPVGLMIYVEDCDTVFKRALAEGGSEDPAAAGSVLRRPLGHVDRSVRAAVDHRHPHQGRVMEEMTRLAAEKAKEMPQTT